MDKLKKRIFILLILLLAAGLAGLGILFTKSYRSDTPDISANASRADYAREKENSPAALPPIPATEEKIPPAAPAEPTLSHPPSAWTEGPCENAVLPPDSPQNLTCRWGEKGFCAFFDNGRPFFCRTKNAQTRYQLNRWGTSITVTQKTPLGQPLTERYYANDQLSRATDYDEKNNLVTTVWFDGNSSFRLTQTDNNGKVLDKYYFTAGKPYVRYPGGNDMGEINGPWELKNEQIFTDGKPLYTLPGPKLAPDVCMIFNGYCPLPTMPDTPKEFPEPIFPPSSTK